MAEDKNLTQLIINEMTKAQYEALDKVNEDEIYVLTDVDTTIHTDNSTLQGDGSIEKPIGLSDTIISTLNNKQDKLTAGSNIVIENNIISSTAHKSFFRGRWETWEDVPSNADSYPEDFNGNRTPTTNDYMVVVDASQYVPDINDSIIISKDKNSHYIIINGVSVGFPNQTRTHIYDTVTYTVENTNGGGIIKLYADKTVQHKGQIIPAGTTIIITSYSDDAIEPANLYYSKLDNLSGAWRFGYKGVWAVDNESGWKPEYQIEDTLPMATETQAGINKTYTAGTNIRIEDNVISSTAQESFFRGRFAEWTSVPTSSEDYTADFHGNTTPSYNDYIVVEDASLYIPQDFLSDPNNVMIRNLHESGARYTIEVVIQDQIRRVYYQECANGKYAQINDWLSVTYEGGAPGVWYIKTTKEFYINNVFTPTANKLELLKTNTPYETNFYLSEKPGVAPMPIYGSWRFVYHGVWADDNILGWEPEYQVEETLPMASNTQAGIAKLYTTSGSNADGAMTQRAVGDAINAHNTATNAHSNIRGVAGGLATLDNNAKVPMAQINDALIGNVSYQGLWDAATNTPFLADPTGGLPPEYKALGYIDFTSNSFIDTGVFIDETDETVEYDIKMTPSNTGCFPFGAAGSNANENNTGSVYFYGSTLEYFAGSTRSIRLGEVVKDKDYIINIKLDQTTQTITVIENDLRTTQSYGGSIISPVSIILGGLRYGTASNPTRSFGYNGKIHYFVIRKNGIMVKQYQPAQRISDGAYGFYEHVRGEFVVSSGALFASGGGEIEIPKGYYYITTVAGDRFGLHFDVGDWIISAGGYWSKVDNTDAVVSVNGRTGNVVVTAEDLDLSNYVQKTDLATVSTPGLVVASDRTKFVVFPNTGEVLCTSVQKISEVNKLDQNAFISKGTLDTVKYQYVKQGIVDSTYTLTDTEKQKVRNWIGAGVPTVFETMPDIYASAGKTYQYVGETTEEFTSGYFYKSVSQGLSYIVSDSNLTFDFDLFWSELESAGITLETLQMTESDKERGGFSIIGTVESETNYRVQEINGVQVYALLTQSVQVASSYVGVTNKWYYKPTGTFAWERVDVQPAPEGCLTKEEADATYLQLTGGTITGEVVIKNDSSDTIAPLLTLSHGSNDIVIKKSRYSKILNFDNALLDGVSGITPIQSTGELGSNGAFWSKVYVRNLNAGAPSGKDLLVPSKEGTLATLDDIPAATQFEVLPEISENNIGDIVQYTGETTNNYTQGHFYKSTKTITRNIVSSGYTLDTETKIVVNVRIDQFLSHNPVFADPSVSGTQYPAWRADYGDAGFWNVWTQTPNISISETELKNIWGISIVDENGLPYTPVAGDNITIEQQEEINYHWEEINFSEDCLPLSGGALTGPLNINGVILSSQYDNELKIGLVGVDEIINMNLASGSIISVTDSGSLGSGEHKWKTVYTTTLNNGADLALPTEGGTLARTEDIQGVNTNINNHINNTSNPHSVTKAQVGLENVDNTSDINKPISTATQTALNLKADKSDTYTKSEVDAKVSSVYRFMGSVANQAALPTEGQAVGDTYNIEDTGANYAWTGTAWDKLSETIDLTPYLTKEDAAKTYDTTTSVNNKLLTKQDIATAVNYDNITNCITEIPQDIKLELANGVLTLKAGSKVYVPNGAGVFDTETVNVDIPFSLSANGTYMLFKQQGQNAIDYVPPNRALCGPNISIGDGFGDYAVAYKTEPNSCGLYENDGKSNYNLIRNESLPICVFTVSNGAISSIDQVFNGFGYIDSTIFVLPGVKGLVPNGRNTDGTLKNTTRTTTAVSVYTASSVVNDYEYQLAYNGTLAPFYSHLTYNAEENINYTTSGVTSAWAIVGSLKFYNNRVSEFNPKTTFHAADYNDTGFIAHQAMPSSRYTNLTLPGHGEYVTAPADGYFVMELSSGVSGQSIGLRNNTAGDTGMTVYMGASGGRYIVFCPASKGDSVQVYHYSSMPDIFRFVYANGSK